MVQDDSVVQGLRGMRERKLVRLEAEVGQRSRPVVESVV